MAHLKILSIGAGAIGTYIGGSLMLQGHEVVFLERPAVAQKLQQQGLRLNRNGEEHQLEAPQMASSIADALEMAEFDIAIFALKSFDTPVFLESIREFCDIFPPILCLSNGVANEPAIARVLGPDKVIAATVTTAVGRRDAGDVIVEKLRGVGIAQTHPLSGQLLAAFNQAGLIAQGFESPAAMKWSKMLTNLIANASSAILDMPPGEIFKNPKLYAIEIAQLRETLKVMQAQGLKPVDLPGTPIQLLAFAVRFLPLWLSRPLMARAVGGGRGEKMPSFHIDLHQGRGKSEVDYLNGAVVRAGKEQQVPTPINQTLNELLMKLTHGDLPLDAFANKQTAFLAEFE